MLLQNFFEVLQQHIFCILVFPTFLTFLSIKSPIYTIQCVLCPENDFFFCFFLFSDLTSFLYMLNYHVYYKK